jgi:Secretion system C-terminal sorting domain/FG-GAP-like repeat
MSHSLFIVPQRKYFTYCLLLLTLEGSILTSLKGQNKEIGIWFSSWYANQGNYIWAEEGMWGRGAVGKNCNNQFVADVNGDGKEDAITFYSTTGAWFVALSNGTLFQTNTKWISGHGIGASQQFVADVNGDGKSDAVVYFSGNGGSIYISGSTGNRFNNYSLWKKNVGVFSKIFLADVSGDGKADLIGYSNGVWQVMTSNGSTFDNITTWINGLGVGSDNQLVGDVNGDGKADAMVFSKNTGNTYVSVSTGSRFQNYNYWGNGKAINQTNLFLKDINNDKKADLAYFDKGTWSYYPSTGTNFNSIVSWKTGHGTNSSFAFINKIDGIANSAITFDATIGKWTALKNDPTIFKPNMLNTWQTWNIRYQPIINGQINQYDSGDNTVIDYQIQQIVTAKIGFIIFDLTNNIDVDGAYISNRAIAICQRIKIWNDNPSNRKLRYAVAIGGVNFSNNPQSIEDESKIVYERFVAATHGGDNYYKYLGKPLIANYTYQSNRDNFKNSTIDKTYSNKFTLLDAEGPLFKDFVGWYTPDTGPIKSNNIMFINPGHNNHATHTKSRENGVFYQKNYQDVFSSNPKLLVIGSYNEYAEENAVAPTSTNFVTGTTEKWPTPNYYWDKTVQNNKIFLCANPINSTAGCSLSTRTEAAVKSTLQIYPNPSTGIFYVALRDDFAENDELLHISMYNTLGQLIHQQKANNTVGSPILLDIQGLPTGMYLVQVQNTKGVALTKSLVVVSE